mmetsp:Transcript_3159/g.3520  ORF Transcript_3159/g.3520 Transcript_3159/m.3520 type:complete len:94 (+) Transcript_3159:84-365(+)
MTSRPPFYSVNDNQNYFVSTGKTSSRVLQAPGGSSSLSLGWSAATTSNNNSAKQVSNNAFANGTNMNCGNVLTDRPSSRVLNPPGGKSSISLG